MMKIDVKLKLSGEEIKHYGYAVVDAIVEYFNTQYEKLPEALDHENKWTLFLGKKPRNTLLIL